MPSPRWVPSALLLALALAAPAPGLAAELDAETQQAVKAYKHAVSLNPRLIPTIQSAPVRKALRDEFLKEARQARREGRMPDAERGFLLAGNFGEGFDLFQELGEVYMAMQSWSKAVVVFKKAILANPASPEAMSRLAAAYEKAGQRQLAAQFFARSLALDPMLIERLDISPVLRGAVRNEVVAKARSLLDRGMPLDSAAKLDLALQLSEEPELRIEQARAYLEAGDLHAASKAFSRGVDLSPGLASEVPAMAKASTSKLLYDQAVAAFAKKELARAKHLFDRSNELEERARTWYNLGNVHVHAGKLDAAIAYYKKALAADSGLDEARLNMAMVQMEKGLYQAAIRDLRELVRSNPDRSEAYDLIAQAYSSLREPAKALRVYQAAINYDASLAPKLAHAEVKQAASLGFFEDARKAFEARDFAESVALCKKAVALFPGPRIYYLMGNGLFAMDDAHGAIPAYEKALELSPRHAPTLNNLGNAHLKLKDYAAASAAFRKATEARPDYAQAHNNLGIALRKMGKVPEAISAYKKALAIDPDYAAAYFNLGNAYQAKSL